MNERLLHGNGLGMNAQCVLFLQIKKHNSELVTFVKNVKEHIKEKETGSLSQLMTQYLNKHTSVTTRQVIQDKLDYLNKKGGKSAAQALTYGMSYLQFLPRCINI